MLVIPFLAIESPKGDLRPVITGGDAFGPSSVIFQVTTNAFLKEHPDAVKAFLADYVDGARLVLRSCQPPQGDPAGVGLHQIVEGRAEFLFRHRQGDYYRDPNACVSAQTIQKPLDAMFEEKLIGSRIDVSKYLDVSHAAEAVRVVMAEVARDHIKGVSKTYPGDRQAVPGAANRRLVHQAG